MSGKITDIPGITVGHTTDRVGLTGCTVIRFDEPCTAGIARSGMGTSTRQVDSLDSPMHVVHEIDAILIAGGSAFGLDATGGVLKCLEEEGRGVPTLYGRVPICPSAAIFDLGIGDPMARPNFEMGYEACKNANSTPDRGSVGAGCGASVGKVFSTSNAMKGGVGMASMTDGDLVVAALAVVNAFGDIIDPNTGKIVAGARTDANTLALANTMEVIRNRKRTVDNFPHTQNTTICVVATNAKFDKTNLRRLAHMSQTALPVVIRPVNTPLDGDMIFTVSAGNLETSLTHVAALAHQVLIDAILDAVYSADGFGMVPTATELAKAQA